MELSKSDIEKLNQIAAVLGNALAELEAITAKVSQPAAPRKRRNLKQARKEKYEYMFASGQLRRKRK